MSTHQKIDMKEYERMKRAYEKTQMRFSSSKFFKRRLYLLIVFFVGTILLTPFLTPSDSQLDIFSTIVVIAFIGMIVLIDQLVLGYRYFDKEYPIE